MENERTLHLAFPTTEQSFKNALNSQISFTCYKIAQEVRALAGELPCLGCIFRHTLDDFAEELERKGSKTKPKPDDISG